MNRIFFAAALPVICLNAAAQSSTSPYAMFGTGAIDNGNHGWTGGMAGLGVGLREDNTLNSSNPAALTAIKEKTFVFDAAVNGNIIYYSGQGRSAVSGTGNIDRLGLGFRAGSFVTLSAGLHPLTTVEYSIHKSTFKNGASEKFDSYFTGSGGLHKIYLSLGFDVFRDLSIGVTGSLVMGQITKTESSDYWTAVAKSVSDITPYIDFGLQYHRKIGNSRTVTAGLAGGLEKDFSLHNTYSLSDNSDSTIVSEKVLASSEQILPAYISTGVSYSSTSLTAGVDYSFHKYSAMDADSDFIRYKDRNRLTVGLSYIPGKYDVRHYWKRIKFQCGAYIDDSCIAASGSKGLNWGVSVGMVFPIRNSTSFYWSLNFKRLTFPLQNRNTIPESSAGLTFGVSFGERWFERRKIE